MASTISARLKRYKLNATFSGKTVSHITIKSDLEARQRRIDVQTVWKTEEQLGAGAFGVVWRQRADNGQVRAVKVISRAQINIQEIEALIELQDHPDLFIRFFGWFEDLDRDAFHIAMEFIQHGHLGKYIAEYKMTVETKEITRQILEGLVVLHEREICHRDLKPQNILVASLSPIWVKITDFGISKRWVGTSLKTNCGTAIYRSPEQLGFLPRELRSGGNSYTNHIDIWALGMIVHEMLTLRIPFLDTYTTQESGLTSCMSVVEDTVDTGLLYRYCQGENPFPCGSLRSHGVPADGIEFVKSLMAVNPHERLSAVAALASEWLAEDVFVDATSPPELELPCLPPVTPSAAVPEPAATSEKEQAGYPPPRPLPDSPFIPEEPETTVDDYSLVVESSPAEQQEQPVASYATFTESAPTEDEQQREIIEVDPIPSPATSLISLSIESGYDQQIASVEADDSPVVPVVDPHPDLEDYFGGDERMSGHNLRALHSTTRKGSRINISELQEIGQDLMDQLDDVRTLRTADQTPDYMPYESDNELEDYLEARTARPERVYPSAYEYQSVDHANPPPFRPMRQATPPRNQSPVGHLDYYEPSESTTTVTSNPDHFVPPAKPRLLPQQFTTAKRADEPISPYSEFGDFMDRAFQDRTDLTQPSAEPVANTLPERKHQSRRPRDRTTPREKATEDPTGGYEYASEQDKRRSLTPQPDPRPVALQKQDRDQRVLLPLKGLSDRRLLSKIPSRLNEPRGYNQMQPPKENQTYLTPGGVGAPARYPGSRFSNDRFGHQAWNHDPTPPSAGDVILGKPMPSGATQEPVKYNEVPKASYTNPYDTQGNELRSLIQAYNTGKERGRYGEIESVGPAAPAMTPPPTQGPEMYQRKGGTLGGPWTGQPPPPSPGLKRRLTKRVDTPVPPGKYHPATIPVNYGQLHPWGTASPHDAQQVLPYVPGSIPSGYERLPQVPPQTETHDHVQPIPPATTSDNYPALVERHRRPRRRSPSPTRWEGFVGGLRKTFGK